VRRAVEELDILDADGSRIPVTASVGLALFEPGESMEMLVDRADRAMYSAKMGGRNRLEVAPTKEAATPPPSQSKENAA
jgi:diguanylate cyclase (GGDEF)-like protein